MTDDVKRSRRGVYYNLNESPYEYVTPYGDLFKFSSKKKLEIYSREIEKEMDRLDKAFEKTGAKDFLPGEIVQLIYRAAYRGFYKKSRV